MQSLKYDLKLFLHDAVRVDLEAFIPLFHRWIQDQRLEELLIDVADYRHVHHGPGVVLIAHDAHYAMDMAAGPAGALIQPATRDPPQPAALQSVDRPPAVRLSLCPDRVSGTRNRPCLARAATVSRR